MVGKTYDLVGMSNGKDGGDNIMSAHQKNSQKLEQEQDSPAALRLDSLHFELDAEIRRQQLLLNSSTTTTTTTTTTTSAKKNPRWNPRSDPEWNEHMRKFRKTLASNLCEVLHETSVECQTIKFEAIHDLSLTDSEVKLKSKAVNSPVRSKCTEGTQI